MLPSIKGWPAWITVSCSPTSACIGHRRTVYQPVGKGSGQVDRVPLRLVSRDVQRTREGRLELVWFHHGRLCGVYKLCVDAADIFWSNEASKTRCECGHPPYIVREDRTAK